MKTYKVKDQEEGVKNAKLFYEAVKLAWGLEVTYCYHDLIHMIKNDLCYDLYDSDNGWGMGLEVLGAKDQKDADVCALAGILKKEDNDDEDEESEEEKIEEENNNDGETEAADELLKKNYK